MIREPMWRRYLRFLRPDVGADVDDEVRAHIETRVEELIAQGRAPADARALALEEFGPVDEVRADLRAIDTRIAQRLQRAERWESLVQDVRYALRSLRRAPAMSVAAIASLALGVGVNSVIFGAVDAVLLRPLPYTAPHELVALWEARNAPAAPVRSAVAPANLMDYRRDTRSFTGLAGYASQYMNLTGNGSPQRLVAGKVTANFFAVLGVAPARGRVFADEEDRPGAANVTVLGDELWRQLGADPALVGRTIQLDGLPYQVVGVLPRGFQSPDQFGSPEPIAMYVPAAYDAELLANHGDHEIRVVGRLMPGVTIAQAREDVSRVSRALAVTYPETNRGTRAYIAPLGDDVVRNVRTSLYVLLGAVGLLWLVACVNLANLLLVRSVARQREVTVCVALGASRSRIVQTLVTYSAVLALTGCGAGLALGLVFQRVLLRFAPPGIPRLDGAGLGLKVFAVMTALSLAAGIVFGLLPSLRVSRAAPGDALRGGERGLSGRGVLAWRSALVVAEIALSLILLTGSGLLLRSFIAVRGVDLGFEPDRVLSMQINLPPARYPDAPSRARFYAELEARVAALPGALAVGYANNLPLRGGWGTGIQIEGAGTGEADYSELDMQAVNAGYFQTLGLTLLAGRGFAPSDAAGTTPVALVDTLFGRRHFPGESVLGKRFRRGPGAPWITIVGVVSAMRRDGKTSDVTPQGYLFAAQTDLYPVRLAYLAVRLRGDPYAALPAVREAVWAIDKDQPIARVRTLSDVVSDSVAQRRFQTVLMLLFAGVAVLLALVGIYGVVSYAVALRTQEFGIRVALGAATGQVVGMVLRQVAVLVALGLAAGLAGAFALSRYLATILFEVKPTDPATFATVALVLATVALAAGWLPARRAARIDPIRALRAE